MDDEPDQRPIGRASRRASKTRQKLLDAALYVFNHRGVEACSIEDITESADVGKGTFYRHFMDKLDILKTLLDLAIEDLTRRMPPEQAPALSFEDRSTQLMAAHMSFFTERPDLCLVFLQGQVMVATRPAAVPGIQTTFTRYIAELERRVATVITAGAPAGQARRIACAIASAACGTISVGLSVSSSKHDVVNNLDLARQMLQAGASQLLRCAV